MGNGRVWRGTIHSGFQINIPAQTRRLVPVKIRPDVSSALVASRADETRLKVGEPNVIGPGIGAGRDVMRAAIVAAIDQDTPNAGFAHLAKGDFLGPLHTQ